MWVNLSKLYPYNFLINEAATFYCVLYNSITPKCWYKMCPVLQWDKEFMPEDQLPQWLVQLTSKKAIDKYVNEAAILLQTIKPSVTSINFTSPHFK